jgi:hypothetical protein
MKTSGQFSVKLNRRPCQSLSVIARHITGTRWNGWTFFGLRAG